MFLAFLSVPAAALGMLLTGSLPLAAIAALATLLAALIASGGRAKKTDRDREASFVDGLYRLGNAMLGARTSMRPSRRWPAPSKAPSGAGRYGWSIPSAPIASPLPARSGTTLNSGNGARCCTRTT